jgi:DNA-binding FrmR family transcriptional regulator
MHKSTDPQEIKSHKDKILHRIRIIQGHLAAIEQMINDDSYCVEIIHQSMAVQSALKKMDMAILDEHLRTCVVSQIKEGEEDKTIAELLKLYEMK